MNTISNYTSEEVKEQIEPTPMPVGFFVSPFLANGCAESKSNSVASY
jgi:hypothetical protein